MPGRALRRRDGVGGVGTLGCGGEGVTAGAEGERRPDAAGSGEIVRLHSQATRVCLCVEELLMRAREEMH